MKIFSKKTSIFLVLLFYPFLSGFSYIPQGASEEMLNQALQGQTLIFNRHYTEAEAHFKKLSEQYPDSPLGSFGLMAMYNARMFENFDFRLDPEFDEVQKQNKILVDKIANSKDASAFDYFLCGASSGLRGFYYVRKDKLWATLSESNQAKKCLEKAQKKDPQFADVNLGFGLFNYWKSVFTNRFKFLPFFKDRRAEGIAQIQKAIDSGVVVSDLARAALAFVYHEQNNGRLGLPIALTLLEKYPDNIIMQNLKGNFLSFTRKNSEALAVFDQVLQKAPETNVARYFKGMAYYRARDNNAAKSSFEDFLRHDPTPAWQAYAHHMLGSLALLEKKQEEAMTHYKIGYKAYPDYKPNLKMILKLREEMKK